MSMYSYIITTSFYPNAKLMNLNAFKMLVSKKILFYFLPNN